MALPESLYADTILVNGTVITVDDAHPTAEAVALKGDRIQHVGSNEEVRQCAGRATRVIDAGGKTVLPGFIEPHTHFMSFGIRLAMVNVRTPPNNSIEDVLARIRERAATTPKGSGSRPRATSTPPSRRSAGPPGPSSTPRRPTTRWSSPTARPTCGWSTAWP